MATATAPKTAVPSKFLKLDGAKWAKAPGKFLDSTGKVGWFAIEALREPLLRAPEPYLRERAADIGYVGAQILRGLRGELTPLEPFERATIVFASDFSPVEAVHLHELGAIALVAEHGSATGHTALLMRSLAVPAVVGVRGLRICRDARVAIVDGVIGRVALDPDPQELAEARARVERTAALSDDARAHRDLPSETLDGVRLTVHANAGRPGEAEHAAELGAAGIGLYRTEWLYLDRDEPPPEDEQAALYVSVAETMKGRPVVLRSFDLGGDKAARFASIEAEPNPALGLRGLRFAFAHPRLFEAQLRAILRATSHGDVRLLLPMVTGVMDLRDVKAALERCRRALEDEGEAVGDLPVGVMIETPGAALLADSLAAECDFLALGTNDLAQYTLAVDRGSRLVGHEADALHPAVLRLLAQVVEVAGRAGRSVHVCGALAADVQALPVLIGLGCRSLSVPVPEVLLVQERIRRLDAKECRELAASALTRHNAAQVRQMLRGRRPEDT